MVSVALAVLAAAPLAFEKNQGAFDAPVRFVARGEHLDAFLLDGAVRLQVHGARGARVAFSLELDGAQAVGPEGLERLDAVHSRFVGPPSRWSTAAPLFARARYAGVYPGIDELLHGDGRALELDFALAPFADERRIALRARGARLIDITAQRALFEVAGERVELRAPRAFQNGKPVSARYVRRADGLLGFSLGPHDRSQAVVVDPVVATLFGYLGGSDADSAHAVALDDAGFVTLAGNTSSVDFPQKLGIKTYGGKQDVFVTRLNGHDGGLVYSTYVGGIDDDTVGDLALEPDGTAVVVGTTLSDDFPNFVPSRAYDGGPVSDGFIIRIAPQGGALSTATYLGGGNLDEMKGVAVDATGAAWVVGDTGSGAFRGTTGATQLFNKNANRDAFVIKMFPDAGIPFIAYLGGAADDIANAVLVDATGLVYVGGQTASADFPVMNETQEHSDAGGVDGFVAALRESPPALFTSTFLGGPGADYVTSMAFTVDGGLYVTGYASGTNNDFYAGTKLDAVTTGVDAWAARLNGQPRLAVQWVGVIGGGNQDFPGGIAVDPRDNLYLVAYGSNMLPGITPMALVPNAAGNNGYFAVIDPSGSQFIYLTYVGGAGNDLLSDIAVQNGFIAMVGQTLSTDLPVRGPPTMLHGDGGTPDVMLLTLTIPPPRIDMVSPDAGPIDGGTRVDILGDYFLPDASVWFGPLQGRVTAQTQVQLSVQTPASPPGAVDVTVRNADGQQTVAPGAFVFVGMPFDAGLPPVASVMPPSQTVDAGTLALIDGSRSSGDTALSFTWTQVEGPTAVDFDAGEVLSFAPPLPGTYGFTLVVRDLKGRDSPPARATVTAPGEAPPPPEFRPGCGCTSGEGLAAVVLLALLRRRRR
jgi:uncharacterized protein (TIGR03382 family)